MAERGDPNVLRLLVVFLRFYARMTQAEFGRRLGVDQAVVSRYEGSQAPSDEILRRMAKVAEIDWPLVEHLRKVFASVLASAKRGTNARSGRPIELSILEPVLLAVTPYLLESSAKERPKVIPPGQRRREASQIWEALERHPVWFRRRLIELSAHAGDWALAERACEASLNRAAHNAGEAREVAELALSIAERAPEEESRSRLQGYCWAHIANALRVANDLSGADEAFARAWDLWRAGAVSKPDWLAEWLLLAMEASLRRDQRRFQEALDLLGQAVTSSKGLATTPLPILLEKEHVLNQMGNIEGALAALLEAAPLVEAIGDCRVLFAIHFNMADNLVHLERYAEAAELLPRVRELAIQQANDLDLLRVSWLAARVAAGQGEAEEAIAGLEQVCREFETRRLPFDVALASLDLAVLWLKDRRAAEVKRLAVAMGWIFKDKGIHREALAALKLFVEAALQETATEEQARQVIGKLRWLAISPS